MKGSVLIACLLLSVVTAAPKHPCNVADGELIGDTEICDVYYICVDWLPVPQNCPSATCFIDGRCITP